SPLPTAANDITAIRAILADLGDLLDALGDLSVAESVHQLLQGNYGRAGGLLDALSKGDHAPEPEVVRTPHPGIDIAYRVALLFTATPPRESGWRAPTTPRAKAEKRLDSWLTQVLPDPRKVRCEVRRVGGAASTDVTLDDLDLAPVDML